MPDFLNIPGNIRQQYMPFTINGSDAMQLFTFKEKMRKKSSKGGVAIIHPFSKHLGTLIQNDSSISYTHGPDGNKKVTYEQFLDEIPSLQIREFVPDAKLTQTFKWFSYLKKGFDAASKDLDSEAARGWQNVKTKLETALNQLSEKMKGLTSGNAQILKDVVAGLTGFYQDRGFNVGDDAGLAVLWLPFILYYRLTTTRTNNIYEFPTSMQNNIFESDGTYGWGDDNGTDFPVLDILGNKAQSLVGLVSSGLASTIKVNAMPAFSPTGSAAATSFDVHIDLINDSEEAAINNFLFCHTLFGNNRWLQYGFVQTGASLYDVKFPGANRFFMCKGKFVCKGKGAFRTPSQNVIDGIVSHKKRIKGKNAAEALSEIDGIQETLGRAEARRLFRAHAQQQIQEKQSRKAAEQIIDIDNIDDATLNDIVNEAMAANDMIKQKQVFHLLSRGRDTEIAALQTKYPNTIVAIKEGKINPNIIVDINGKFSNLYNEINRSENYLKDYMEKRTQAQNELEDNNNGLRLYNEKLNQFKKDNPSLFDEKGKFIPDKADEDQKKILQDIESHIDRFNLKIDHLNSYISGVNTDILGKEKTIENLRRDLERENFIKYNGGYGYNSQAGVSNLELFEESLGADAIQNTVVSVSKDTWRNLIKIPDVYSLTLTFSSLIPDNFNNYLYGWRAGNLDPIDNYFLGEVIEKGVMEKLVDNLIEAVGKG